MGQAPRRDAAACAGAVASQGVGLRRLRHHPRLGAHRSHLGGRRPGGVGLGGGDRRSLGALVLLLAPPAEMISIDPQVRNDTTAPAGHSPDRKPQSFLPVLSCTDAHAQYEPHLTQDLAPYGLVYSGTSGVVSL